MPLLVPEYLFRDVTHIPLDFLRMAGIRALVLDVDNTLTAHSSQEVAPRVADWLSQMKAAGIRLMLASNNSKARVAPFAQKLGLEYASFCCKPAPFWLAAAKKRWGLPRRAMALVGDQLFTDLLAGQFCGVRVLVVRPLYADIKPTIRLKRRLEKPFLARYFKKGGKLM